MSIGWFLAERGAAAVGRKRQANAGSPFPRLRRGRNHPTYRARVASGLRFFRQGFYMENSVTQKSCLLQKLVA